MAGTPEVIDRLRAVLADDTFAIRFAALREIGRGGMGSVHRAIDRQSQQPVAIKLVHAASLHARFTLEAETLERLSHPAIVAYVGHGVTRDGAAYLAMAWIDGESLAERLARGALSIADTLAAGIRIAGALAHAHAAGIVHRDIKPSNVMLPDKDPRRAILIDFGIAKDIAVAHGLTETGQLVGTPGYMSPEQAMGTAHLDARTDLFAFGALLYHCLTGQPPFGGKQAMEVLAHLLLKDPPPVCALVPAVPARLSTLVAALMVKEPEKRLNDAAAIEAELAAIANAIANAETATLAAVSPLHIELATAPTLLERPAPRRSRVPFVVGAAVLATAGMLAIVITRDGATPPPPPAPAPVVVTTDDTDAPSALRHPCERSGSVVCALMCYGDDAAACRDAGKRAYTAAARDEPAMRDRAQREAIDDFLVRGCTLADSRSCTLAGTWMRRRISRGDTYHTRAQWVASFERGCALRDGAACNLLAKHLSEESPTENFTTSLGYLERGCEYLNTQSCMHAAEMLQRRAGDGDLARATTLRTTACRRGHTPACSAQ